MARGAITRGTARDLADHGHGFSANGESEYSRRSARAPDVTMVGHVAKGHGPRTHAALIAENESQLAKLRGDILLTTDRVRLAKLRKSFEIKLRFVERLKKEE